MPNSAHEDALIEAVTAKLLGGFYVGQRVRVCNAHLVSDGKVGVVTDLSSSLVGVQLDSSPRDDSLYFYRRSLQAAP